VLSATCCRITGVRSVDCVHERAASFSIAATAPESDYRI